MKMLSGIALAILAGHACAAGRPTLAEMPAPVRSTLVHAYLEDDDPDRYSEVFFEPAVIDGLPGAIVTLRVNDGAKVEQGQHRFILPEKDERLCNEAGSVMRHAFGGEIVGEPKWRVVLPVDWDERRRPNRSYAEGTSPIDIIGTELCVAHFSTFGSDLEERTTTLMKERSRQAEERSAAKQARHDADVTDLRGCLRDREALARGTASADRQTRELNSAADGLAIARASLELQKNIIDSYEASASSRTQYNRQVQAYLASAAEHDRKVKAHERVLERRQADADRIDATCVQGREFVGSAVHEVCRTNDSDFCAKATSRR
jgi:hypothetical protein